MKKRRWTSFVMVVVVLTTIMSLLTGCSESEKIPVPIVQEDVFIYDADNVIDDNVEKELNKMLVELEDKAGAEFAVVSVESLLDREIEDYANELFNTLGIGKKDKDNGVLLLFSRSDERVRLEIGRGLEGCLNDSKCGRILDDYFVPYRDEDKYSEATEYTVIAVLKELCEEYDISISGVDERNLPEKEDETNYLLIIIVVILVIGVLVALAYKKAGYGDDDFSSGGFFSGGSSGGGFGGGFSGGGGASR